MCFDCSGYGRSGGPTCSVELGENQGVSESMPCSSTYHRIVLVQGITTHFKDLLYYHQKMFAQKELSTRNGLKYRENWSNHFFDTLTPPPLLGGCGGSRIKVPSRGHFYFNFFLICSCCLWS